MLNDVCSLKKACVWGLEKDELQESGRISLLRLLQDLPDPLIWKIFMPLQVRGTHVALTLFFFPSSPCALYSLFCASSPFCELLCVYEPGLGLPGLCPSPDVSALGDFRHFSCKFFSLTEWQEVSLLLSIISLIRLSAAAETLPELS